MPMMNEHDRDTFLAEVRIGVLAIERSADGPLLAPIWYRRSADGDFEIAMADASAKALLLRRAGRASLCVQDESRPYRYVNVSGPVTVAVMTPEARDATIRDIATRYLGSDAGARYAEAFPGHDEALVTLHPTRWHAEVLG